MSLKSFVWRTFQVCKCSNNIECSSICIKSLGRADGAVGVRIVCGSLCFSDVLDHGSRRDLTCLLVLMPSLVSVTIFSVLRLGLDLLLQSSQG